MGALGAAIGMGILDSMGGQRKLSNGGDIHWSDKLNSFTDATGKPINEYEQPNLFQRIISPTARETALLNSQVGARALEAQQAHDTALKLRSGDASKMPADWWGTFNGLNDTQKAIGLPAYDQSTLRGQGVDYGFNRGGGQDTDANTALIGSAVNNYKARRAASRQPKTDDLSDLMLGNTTEEARNLTPLLTKNAVSWAQGQEEGMGDMISNYLKQGKLTGTGIDIAQSKANNQKSILNVSNEADRLAEANRRRNETFSPVPAPLAVQTDPDTFESWLGYNPVGASAAQAGMAGVGGFDPLKGKKVPVTLSDGSVYYIAPKWTPNIGSNAFSSTNSPSTNSPSNVERTVADADALQNRHRDGAVNIADTQKEQFPTNSSDLWAPKLDDKQEPIHITDTLNNIRNAIYKWQMRQSAN